MSTVCTLFDNFNMKASQVVIEFTTLLPRKPYNNSGSAGRVNGNWTSCNLSLGITGVPISKLSSAPAMKHRYPWAFLLLFVETCHDHGITAPDPFKTNKSTNLTKTKQKLELHHKILAAGSPKTDRGCHQLPKVGLPNWYDFDRTLRALLTWNPDV